MVYLTKWLNSPRCTLYTSCNDNLFRHFVRTKRDISEIVAVTMHSLTQDPVVNVVHGQIKREIRLLLEAKCFSGAVKLTYCGIDTMAFLGMPEKKANVERQHFIDWCGRYLRFAGRQQLTGEDVYGARCALLHAHGTESDLSRKGKCRQVAYMDQSEPPVRFDPTIDEGLVLVSVPALVESFFRGVDDYLIHLFADPVRARVAEARFQGLVHTIPLADGEDDSASRAD